MATMILLPDGATGHTFHWAGNGVAHVVLESDDGDTSYVECSTNGRNITVTFTNPSVVESDIASITSVRFLSTGRSTHRTTDSEVDISFVTPYTGYSETVSYDNHASSYETINGTARTSPNPLNLGGAWTYSNLENLSLKLTKNGTVEVRMSYLALEVTYVPASYGNSVGGVSSGDISKVNGIATGDISKVNGV